MMVSCRPERALTVGFSAHLDQTLPQFARSAITAIKSEDIRVCQVEPCCVIILRPRSGPFVKTHQCGFVVASMRIQQRVVQ